MAAKSKTPDVVTQQIDSFMESRTNISILIDRVGYCFYVEGYVIGRMGRLVLCADRAGGRPKWKIGIKLNSYESRTLTKEDDSVVVLLNQRSGGQIRLAEITEDPSPEINLPVGAADVPLTPGNRHL